MLNSEAMNAQLNPFSGAQSGPITHTAQVPSHFDTQVDGDTFTLNNDNETTILFDPLVNKGIVKFVVQNIKNLIAAVGIADETVKYGRKEFPDARGKEKIVRYDCPGWIEHIDDYIKGNAEFYKTGDRVTLELNMDSSPRTLTFFVNDEEQPNYATNIPASVRFFASLWLKDDSFKVLKFEALPAPTAQHAAGSRSWEYGTEWEE
ncbi:MAG: hypothetical protein EZS28_026753 [Streblomastix strix]|uniref:Uncharacterized protein n=1 Tax=Streblomastix strix TaxID=222440 RepID=A0A5J4V5Y3_9EUKA|nr:MAG: hypothetical protein EZS28_026753 [Streblomastix strix]